MLMVQIKCVKLTSYKLCLTFVLAWTPMLRVEGRLENTELPIDTKHPFILPSRHALTRLIILNEHSQAGHAGPAYTLMLSH